MAGEIKVRKNWLRGMYIYTIVGAGMLGLGIIIMPGTIKSLFGWPNGDPIPLGIVGCIYAAMGILSILGIRSPLKFSPVLLLQLFYKSIWFIGVAIPLLVTGQFPAHGTVFAVIFATYIIGDIIAIPFAYLFAKAAE